MSKESNSNSNTQLISMMFSEQKAPMNTTEVKYYAREIKECFEKIALRVDKLNKGISNG